MRDWLRQIRSRWRRAQHPADDVSPLETLLQPGALPRAQSLERFFNRVKHFRRVATRY